MKRIQYHHYGGAEELRLEEAEEPEPAQGQIRVRVMAAAVNGMDWKIRRGEMKMISGFRVAWAMTSQEWSMRSGRVWNGARWATKCPAPAL